jgi:hypothetical protein
MNHSHRTTGRKKSKKQSAKATLAEVMKEMAKPRVAMSAREVSVYGLRIDALVVENDIEK